MGTRQYIGARYVPKFWDNGSGSTEWVPNIPYESMVVVTYMNNSYTSKVPVPATQVTPNVDSEHWALTGAYNAQVEQYRQEVAECVNSVEKIKDSAVSVSFEQFGAVGDGITDDTAAIKNAVEYAANNGYNIVSNSKNYKITDTITVNASKIKYFIVPGTFIADITNKDCIIFKNDQSEKTAAHCYIICNVSGTQGYGGYQFPAEDENYQFTNLPMVGIHLLNISRSYARLNAAMCNVGIWLDANGTGNVYNTIDIGEVWQCVVGVDVRPSSDDAWVNENLILNGSYAIATDYYPYNTRTISIRLDSNHHAPNNNVFIKPSFESGGLPIYVKNGNFNTFEDFRCENGNDPVYARVDTGSTNKFIAGYGYDLPVIIGDKASSSLCSNINNDIINVYSRNIVRWKFDHKKYHTIGTSGGASKTVIDGAITGQSLESYTLSADRARAGIFSVAEDGNSITTTSQTFIGWCIDADGIDKIIVSGKADKLYAHIIPIGENGEHLTPSDEFTGYGSAGCWVAYGSYTASEITNSYMCFGVANKVSSKYIVAFRGTNISELAISCITKPSGSRKLGKEVVAWNPQKDITDITITTGTISDGNSAGKVLLANDNNIKNDGGKQYYTLGWIKPTDSATVWNEIKVYQS